jgi:hypothetical protein
LALSTIEVRRAHAREEGGDPVAAGDAAEGEIDLSYEEGPDASPIYLERPYGMKTC